MIRNIRYYIATGTDPYTNLAVEKYLLDTVAPDECILYLWQNQNTVVIGCNQNAWNECRTALLEQEGGRLARRLSGGGAVFHDLGNLNFTFIMAEENYDLPRQLDVIRQACGAVGIQAEPSGRNDLLAEGCKFSGNAFYHQAGKAYHHGTLLINVDMDKLGRYLSPPKAKLESKGIQSVRSRVINLSQLCPTLTCDTMKQHMVDAMEKVYGTTATEFVLDDSANAFIAETAALYGSWDWLYGKKQPFSFSCEDKFPWGYIQLLIQAENGIVQSIKVYTDAMDSSLAATLETALTGCRFTLEDLCSRLQSAPLSEDISNDLCQMLTQNI